MPDSDLPREEYEHVPWSQLASAARPTVSLRAAVAVGVVAAVAIGLFGSRLMSRDAPAEIPDPAVIPDIGAVAASTTSVATTVPLPQLYREADLLTVLPDEEIRLAAMRAEWFVTDYFTVTDAAGDPAARQSYVEWARAFRVDGADPERFTVSVAYRLLVAGAAGTFDRLAVQAVEVVVERDRRGSLAVADLPRPVAVPADGEPVRWPEAVDVPPAVAAEAVATMRAAGLEGDVVGGHPMERGWRVVVGAAVPGAPTFPMVVVVEDG